MIINKFVFPIKADLKFVEGGIPQGYLTANDINKDMFYVISPTVGDTIVSANFQNNVLNAEPVKVEFTPSSLKVSELVSENEIYYDDVKDWNVWQGFMPSKPLEYVAYNRAGEIGISFNFKQLLVPAIPHGLEVKGFVEQEDFVPTQDGVYVVKIAYYEYDNVVFGYHDLLIKVGNDVIRKGAMTQSGNTGSVEYAVDPSVYDSEYESEDPDLTKGIRTKLGENSADIKLLSLKFNNYYTIEEVDGLILDTQEFTYDRDTIDNKDAAVLQEAKDYTYSQVEIVMNKANNLENANMLKDVVYNNVNGVLTFTRYDDTTKEIDLPLELIVTSGYYDEVANELVLVLANSSEIRIPVDNLLTDLDAHNIRFNGSGTNYLVNKNDVESAVKELDTQVKGANNDMVALKYHTEQTAGIRTYSHGKGSYNFTTSTFSGWASYFKTIDNDFQIIKTIKTQVRARAEQITQVRLDVLIGDTQFGTPLLSNYILDIDVQPFEVKEIVFADLGLQVSKGQQLYISVQYNKICDILFSTENSGGNSRYITDGQFIAVNLMASGTAFKVWFDVEVSQLGELNVDVIPELTDYQAVKAQVANIQTNLDTAFKITQTITPTYEYDNWENSYMSYNTSIFSGWGWGIGAPETIQAFQIQVQTRDIPFTEIKYNFTENNKSGQVLREGFIDLPNLEPNTKYDISVVLPIPITGNTTQLYFIYQTNQLSTAFRSRTQPVGATGTTTYSIEGTYIPPVSMSDVYGGDVFAFAFRAGTALDLLLPTDTFLEGIQMDIKNPSARVILPNEYVAVVGDTIQIFYRGIIEAVNPYVYDIFFKCTKGNAYTRYWQFTPTLEDVGTYTITVTVKTSDGKELANETTTLRVVSKATSPIVQKNVLCFGDSLTGGTGKWVQEFYRRLTGSGGTPSADGLSNINFIGTQNGGGGSLHEGYGGWTWDSFLATPNPTTDNFWAYVASHDKDITDQHSIWSDGTNQWSLETIESTRLKFTRVAGHTGNIPTGSGSLTHVQNAAHASNIVYTSTQAEGGSPFYDLETNSISFTKYCLRHGFDGIDYVFVLLSWNGMSPHRATAADHAGLITSAKTLIDILHTEYPNAKVQIMGIQLPSLNGGMGANYGAGGGYSENYGNVRTVFGLNLAYKDWANEEGYSQFIEHVNTSGQFDSENNMPEGDAPVNIRSAKLEKRGTNGVHPNTDGYYQIADVAYRHFHKKLQE